MTTAFDRTKATLLHEIPWLTDIVMGQQPITLMGDLVTDKFVDMILAGERELQGTSASSAYIRRIIGADGLSRASVDAITSRYMNLVANKLTAYKTIDAMQWVATGGYRKQSTQVVRPLKYLQGVPKLEQLKCTQMSHWPTLARNAFDRVKRHQQKSSSVGHSKILVEPATGDVVTRLYASIRSTMEDSKTEKILSNVEVGALHIATYLAGDWEMQPMQSQALFATTTAMSSARQGHDNLAVLRQPMYLATSISPLVLLQEKLLFKASFPNYAVVDAYRVYGFNKPSIILDLEFFLWDALIGIGEGKVDSVTAITDALNRMESRMSAVDEVEAAATWFSDQTKEAQAALEFTQGLDAGLQLRGFPVSNARGLPSAVSQQEVPGWLVSQAFSSSNEGRQHLSISPNDELESSSCPYSQYAATIDPRQLLPNHQQANDPDYDTDNQCPLGSPSQAPSPPESPTAADSPDLSSPEPEAAVGGTADDLHLDNSTHQLNPMKRPGDALGSTSDAVNSPVRRSKRLKSAVEEDESGWHGTGNPARGPAPGGVGRIKPSSRRRKRKRPRGRFGSGNRQGASKSSSEDDADGEPAVDLSIAVPRIIDDLTVIDATPLDDHAQAGDQLPPRLAALDVVSKCVGIQSIKLFYNTGCCINYEATFYTQKDLDDFCVLMTHVESQYFNSLPLYLSAPGDSHFHIVSSDTFHDDDDIDASLPFYLKHIIIPGPEYAAVDVDLPTLQEMFGIVSDIHLFDHAKNAPRNVLGTYDDLVIGHTSVGRALSTTKIPMPFSHHSPPMSMATDLQAWADTLDHPYCKRHVPFPLSHTRWGTVATTGAFGDWNEPVNGVCTYISVLRGCQYVVVASPGAQEGDPVWTSPSDCPSDWEYDGIVQTCGMMIVLRPGVQYRVLTIQSTICAGGTFYSIDNMTTSTACFIDSFLRGDLKRNDAQSEACWMTLQRIILYIAQCLLDRSEGDVHDDADEGHLPDLRSIHGIFHLLSLFNFAELSNVLHPDTYRVGIAPKDRLFMIHVRLRARTLIAWLCQHFALLNGDSQVSLRGVINEYLEYQMVAMSIRKAAYDERGISHPLPGFTGKALDRELRGCREDFATHRPISQMPSLFFPDLELYSVEHISDPNPTEIPASGDTPSDKEWKKRSRGIIGADGNRLNK